MKHFARATTAILVIAAAIVGASCGGGAREPIGSEPEPIIGGSPDTTDDAVVAVVQPSHGILCSGTLVAPNIVLTAAHCLYQASASAVQVLVGPDSTNPVQTLAASSVVVYPTYTGEDTGIAGGVNLGVVYLATPLSSITPVAVNTTTSDANLTGASVTVVGYGVDDGTDDTGAGTRRSVILTVASVCSRIFLAGGEDANACEGDSGGAVLLDGALVAVVSGGPGCYTTSTFTRTDAHADWIASVLAGGSAATCPATCTQPDPSCGAATETRPAVSEDAGADKDASAPEGGAVHASGGCSASSGRARVERGLGLSHGRHHARRAPAPSLVRRPPAW